MKWQDVTNVLVGVWLIIVAFLNFSANANLWNYLISGTAIIILSFWVGLERKA